MKRKRISRAESWLATIGTLLGITLGASAARAQDAGAPQSRGVDADAGVPPPTNTNVATPNAAATAAQEEAEIAAELARMHPSARAIGGVDNAAAARPSAESTGASASSRGLSNLLNPAISANGLLLGGYSSRRDEDAVEDREDLETGFHLQEVELQVSAIVDPYLRGDITLTGSAEGVGFEEAYVTTLEIPRLTIRAGLFKTALGRHNGLHTHAFPFLTAPIAWRTLLGGEGLSDPGISFDVLLPLPFYAEVTAQVFEGDWAIFDGGIEDDPETPEDETFPDKREAHDFGYVAHLKTLFDLSNASTLELGATYVGGHNGFGSWTSLVAGDVTLKWRPVDRGRYTSFEWQTEWLWLHRPDVPDEDPIGGGYTHMRYQFNQQWWIQARASVLGIPGSSDDRVWRGEPLIAYVLDEFAALRLQYGIERAERADARFVHDAFLQVVFSMGPHPAHAY